MYPASPASLRRLRVLFVLVVVCPSAASCTYDTHDLWFCINPATGLLDNAPYDANHYAGGRFDPCHCYDPCGPQKTCPVEVDAGPLPPGCHTDAGL